MAPVNYASSLLAPQTPFEVVEAPLPDPTSLGDDEVIIKNKAVAIKSAHILLAFPHQQNTS